MEFAVRANRISPANSSSCGGCSTLRWPGSAARRADEDALAAMAKEIERMRVNGKLRRRLLMPITVSSRRRPGMPE